MALGTLAAIATGAKSIYDYANRPQTTPFRRTARGMRLSDISRRGRFPRDVRDRIISNTARPLFNRAGLRRGRSRGILESQGLGGSIAGTKILDEPERDVNRSLSDIASDIAMRNEVSKQVAGDEFALGETQTAETINQEKTAAKRNLGAGLFGAAAQFGTDMYQGHILKKLKEGKLNSMQDLMVFYAEAGRAGLNVPQSFYGLRGLLTDKEEPFPDLGSMSEAEMFQFAGKNKDNPFLRFIIEEFLNPDK